MYTKGIRKIFDIQHNLSQFEKVCKIAKQCEYKALNFNGNIYILHGSNTWALSPFTIDDFKD